MDGKDDPGKDSRPVPPWMVNEATNLSAKQRGQIPSKPDEISETKDDNKQKSEDEKSIEVNRKWTSLDFSIKNILLQNV